MQQVWTYSYSFSSVKDAVVVVATGQLVLCHGGKLLNSCGFNAIRMEAVNWLINNVINQQSENYVFRISISNRKDKPLAPRPPGSSLPRTGAASTRLPSHSPEGLSSPSNLHVPPTLLFKLTLSEFCCWSPGCCLILLMVSWSKFHIFSFPFGIISFGAKPSSGQAVWGHTHTHTHRVYPPLTLAMLSRRGHTFFYSTYLYQLR